MLGLILITIVVAAMVCMGGFYYWHRKSALNVPATESDLLDTHLTLKHDLPNGTGRIYIDGKLYKVKAPGFLAAGDSVRITDFNNDTLVIQPNKFKKLTLQTAELS